MQIEPPRTNANRFLQVPAIKSRRRVTTPATCIALLLLLVTFDAALGARDTEIEITYGPGVNKAAIKFWKDAEDQLEHGDLVNSRRNIDAALAAEPKLWPAYYTRARLFMVQGKWESAVADCNAGLQQSRSFVELAVIRAEANGHLGKYKESLAELDHVIRLRPTRPHTLAPALSARAWLLATCPDASLRNGKQAIGDAKQACTITGGQDEDMLDTLAAAYAETGDFDSAVRTEEKALKVKNLTFENERMLERHLALYKEHHSIAQVSQRQSSEPHKKQKH